MKLKVTIDFSDYEDDIEEVFKEELRFALKREATAVAKEVLAESREQIKTKLLKKLEEL